MKILSGSLIMTECNDSDHAVFASKTFSQKELDQYFHYTYLSFD